DDRVALMRRLFVDAAYRNQQIGMNLIDRVFQFCKEVGYQEIIFKTTSRMEGAAKLCKKRGFLPRAKLNLGAIELLKFSLSLRDGVAAAK
ncbi:MAG: GNAT family N-acetyltransferase, partial [Candidatus Omnitrophica bacterium]|nr:GNAT family N-acetyltransferase [Candidatus Omnitrophota bacterium]